MRSRIVEIEELCQMLLDDISHETTRWGYETVHRMLGYDGDYPNKGTLRYFKWGQKRGQILIAVNQCFARKSIATRVMVDYGSSENGELQHEWRAVPKNEILPWTVLESTKKVLSPMQASIKKSLEQSNSTDLPMKAKVMFRGFAGALDAISGAMLKESQSIDGLSKASIKELQEWYNRKAKNQKRLLSE